MSRFIKLTKFIINTRHIVHIQKEHEIYHVYLHNNHTEGFSFFGSGSVSTNDNIITVCKNNHSKDYDIMTSWVDKL